MLAEMREEISAQTTTVLKAARAEKVRFEIGKKSRFLVALLLG
jgi:hypothetical protein